MKNKVSIITGAASGIGYALAKQCIHQQMHVVILDNNALALEKAVHSLQLLSALPVKSLVCDVTHLSDVESAAATIYKEYQRVDLLINNAGVSGSLLPLWEMSIDRIRQLMDVNVYGVLHGIKAFLPFMFTQTFNAHIVNMASVYGLCSSSLVSDYSMSKHAVVALSESLYFDLQHQKKPVDVSVVCPSFVNTPLLSHTISNSRLHQRMQNLFERSRTADEVAEEIMRAIPKREFYIFPDKEVRDYCAQRLEGIHNQQAPAAHGLEKIMKWIMRE